MFIEPLKCLSYAVDSSEHQDDCRISHDSYHLDVSIESGDD
jgi:hypothetical protein